MHQSVLLVRSVVIIVGLQISCHVHGHDDALRFPRDFIFGAASSAYQSEGAWNEDGKGESIWDHMTRMNPKSVAGGSNGQISADSYHRYQEDVDLLTELGVDYYRFSIAWTRIMPNGDPSSLNQKGIDFYNRLIDALLRNRIKPMVTIFHWDLPQSLQNIGGMTNSRVIDYFVKYADTLFELYGDRVDRWITINEPLQICEFGYGGGSFAPLINSYGFGSFMCTQNVLLINAHIYELFQRKYKRRFPRTKLGFSVYCSKYYPFDADRNADRAASRRAQQLLCGMYLHPIFSEQGGYPILVKDIIHKRSARDGLHASRLSYMDDKTRKFIRGKADFLGLNFYAANYTSGIQPSRTPPTSIWEEMFVQLRANESWPQSSVYWQRSYPVAMRDILNWIRVEYNNPEVIITENGWAQDATVDTARVDYIKSHLQMVLTAINDGCNVTGYVYWSLMDNLEWADGFTVKFGLYHVDFNDPSLPRTPRQSALAYKCILKRKKNWNKC